jgi:hypothetical protein
MPTDLRSVSKLECALYKALPELRSPEWLGEVCKNYRRIERSQLTCPICRHGARRYRLWPIRGRTGANASRYSFRGYRYSLYPVPLTTTAADQIPKGSTRRRRV